MSGSLSTARLYGILDTGYAAPEFMPAALRAMIAGGIDLIQLRAKDKSPEEIAALAPALYTLCREARIPFIINDHPSLAHLADGIHVGQDDFSVAEARALAQSARSRWVHCGSPCPPWPIIGKSTHSLAQARAASAEGADYIGFGPLFPTPTKAGRPAIGLQDLAEVHRHVPVPVFCIGGIKQENLPTVLTAGARRVVIVSGILQAVDIFRYVADCKRLLAAAS